MRADLRRRLGILEAAHGRTPLAMAWVRSHIRSLSAMTEEELIAAIIRANEIHEMVLSGDIEEIRKIPSQWPELSDLEFEWVQFYSEYFYAAARGRMDE